MIARTLVLSVAALALAAPAGAQSEAYKVFDARPVITEGLYKVTDLEGTVVHTLAIPRRP